MTSVTVLDAETVAKLPKWQTILRSIEDSVKAEAQKDQAELKNASQTQR